MAGPKEYQQKLGEKEIGKGWEKTNANVKKQNDVQSNNNVFKRKFYNLKWIVLFKLLLLSVVHLRLDYLEREKVNEINNLPLINIRSIFCE